MSKPTLIVVSGLPGTGKTTLAAGLVQELGATYLRVDAVEAPLIRAGLDVGRLGYDIVWEVAVSNLRLGRSVVVDLVNPLPVTRALWWAAARVTRARCHVLECVVTDLPEHRRRVEERSSDLPGIAVPTWAQVQERDYVPWDEERDGSRTVVDLSDSAEGLRLALAALAGSHSGGQGPVGADGRLSEEDAPDSQARPVTVP